ncbi:helix-turn-helix domain-containing protein [Rhodococcus hoagii]|nr:helix-turn-helix domain-containing protein [Prescottella equi]
MSDERARFAQIVAERRRLLGLTLDELQAAGGPSDVTTGKIEKGAIASPSARTLRRLDHALRWVEGSAARRSQAATPHPSRTYLPRTGQARARLRRIPTR